MAAVRHLEFAKIAALVTCPVLAEIWRYIFKMAAVRHLVFAKIAVLVR